MDLVVGFPRTGRKNDSIWVIANRLTKSAHFLPVKVTYSAKEYAKVYIKASEVSWSPFVHYIR